MTCSCTTGLRRIQLHMPPALRVFCAARAVLYVRAACFASRGRCFLPEPRVLRHAGGAFCPSHVFCVARAVLYARATCFAPRGRCFMTETRVLRRASCALCPSHAGCATLVASYARDACFASRGLRFMSEPRRLRRTSCVLCPSRAFLRRTSCALCPSHAGCATLVASYTRAARFCVARLRFMPKPHVFASQGCALCLSRTGCTAGLHLMPALRVFRRTGGALCPLRRAPAPSPHTLHTPAKPPTYTLIHAPTGRPPRVNSILNRPSTCGKERKKVV